MANRRRGSSDLWWIGVFCLIGFTQTLYDYVTTSWQHGNHGPGIKLGALVAAVAVAAGARWWVREYGIAIWNRRRRKQRNH
ncbi:MAG: hypothetical protein HOV70_20080 [Streptomyces sp.]|nr:hypothetical protein [Streptomyces sp.]